VALATVRRRPIARPNPREAELMRLVEAFLVDQYSDDDYGAMASPGYRPRDWDPVRTGSGAWRGFWQRWELEAGRRADLDAEAYALYVRRGIPRELRRLPRDERTVLQLHCVGGPLSWRKLLEARDPLTGRLWLPSLDNHMQAYRLHEHGLLSIVRALWDGSGAPKFGRE
jgi:hypothetical protein